MKKSLFILTILLLTFSAAPIIKAATASLYLSPSAGTYTVGNTFMVSIQLNSGGVAINAADGTIVFNPDNLEVVSISKTGSIFSLWVQDPVFSNSLGTIDFAGGKPSPGFSGSAGTIVNVTFKAKTSGTANLTFAAGSVLADDGKGTNILTHMGSGSYTLVAKTITPLPPGEEYVPPSTPSGQTPAAPVISSATHPEEDQWHSNNDPQFSWKLPADVTGVSLLLHEKATANPGSASDGSIESKTFEDVEDGLWYFHLKFKNQYGWGRITHRKVLIDTVSPNAFEIGADNQGDDTNPTPSITFYTADSLSGIAYYEVLVNKETQATTTSKTQNNPFIPSPMSPGENLIAVKAFDQAGNFTLAESTVTILPIPTPEITKIPKSIRIGDILTIEGRSEPKLIVRIYIQELGEDPMVEIVNVDEEGNFVLSYDKNLAKGEYLVWARSQDARGALSYLTEEHSLDVGLPPFLKFGKIAVDYLTTMVTLIVLIVGAIAVIFYTWYRVSMWRKRVAEETEEISQSVSGAFRALREELEEQIADLDKKPGLTKKEKAIRDKLQEALDVSEKFIKKEIRDVTKQLK